MGAGLVFLALGCLLGCGAPERPRSLVLISLDTVRADHLSLYGYDRPTSPTLDRLAERSVVFTNAFTQEVNTAPSHGSMFTGAYPHEHGCLNNYQPLGARHVTLAQVLQAAGFRTGGFVSGFPMRAALTQLDRGFEVWDDSFDGLRRDGHEVTERALQWLAARESQEPFFLFLHLYDAHGPYEPPDDLLALFRSADKGRLLDSVPEYQQLLDAEGRPERHLNEYVDRYDAMIRLVDGLVARVLDAVDLDEVVVVVLSDHGETLGERSYALDHGAQLYDEQIRIPLLLAAPGLAPDRVDVKVETVDLLPTLLDLLGLTGPAPSEIAGRSLLPVLRGHETGREVVHAAARADSDRFVDRGYELEASRQLLAVRTDRWKLIRYPVAGGDPIELYDLAADAAEKQDVASEHPDVRDELLATLDAWHEPPDPAPARELPDDVREKLEALGYGE